MLLFEWNRTKKCLKFCLVGYKTSHIWASKLPNMRTTDLNNIIDLESYITTLESNDSILLWFKNLTNRKGTHAATLPCGTSKTTLQQSTLSVSLVSRQIYLISQQQFHTSWFFSWVNRNIFRFFEIWICLFSVAVTWNSLNFTTR